MNTYRKYTLVILIVSVVSLVTGLFLGGWLEASKWRDEWKLSQYIETVVYTQKDLISLDLIRSGKQEEMIEELELYLTHRIISVEELEYLVYSTEGRFEIKLIAKLEDYIKKYPDSLLYREKKMEIDKLISEYGRIQLELNNKIQPTADGDG